MIDGINAMVPIAHVQVGNRDFNAYISMCSVTRNIHVFKYNDRRCDYEVFDNQRDAQNWINLYLSPE